MATGRDGRAARLNDRLRGAQRTNIDSDDSFNINIGSTPAQSGPETSTARESPTTRDAAASQNSPDMPTPRAVDPIRRTRGEGLNQRLRGAQRTYNVANDTFNIDVSASSARNSSVSGSPSLPLLNRQGRGAGLDSRLRGAGNVNLNSGNSFDFGVDVSSTDTPRPKGGTIGVVEPSTDIPGYDHDDDPYPLPNFTGQSDFVAGSPAPEQPSAVSTNLPSIAGAALNEVQTSTGQTRPNVEPSAKYTNTSLAEPTVVDPHLDNESSLSSGDASQADISKPLAAKRRISAGNAPMVDSEDEEDDDTEQRPTKRRSQSNSANQKQPARKRGPGRPRKDSTRRQSEPVSSFRKGKKNKPDDNTTVEITVQRLINAPDADAEDELQTEIPFANRGGETVVDVFAQVCEEIIFEQLGKLERTLISTDDDQIKKECRIQMRAITAYKEELNTRLLQHAIHLNHWHSLRRRLRHVQKEKLALRDEIISLKAEREQVALRMDAIRIKHESDSKASKFRLEASALMHDIDLAVERGHDAPPLSGAAQRDANLGNLDLTLAQLSDQLGSNGGGGLLQTVKEFNNFLERAATALESG